MTELGKVDDSYKRADYGGNHDHAGDEFHAQTKYGAGEAGIKGSMQHSPSMRGQRAGC